MYDFDFYQPKTLSDAVDLLDQISDARIVAGGTDLMVLMKDRLVRPSALVSLAECKDLEGINSDGDKWVFGPITPLHQLEHSEVLRRKYPALYQAILHLAAPPIRNQATLGGNICLDPKCIYYNQSQVWERSLPRCLKAGGNVCHVAPAGKRCVGALAAETVGPLWLYDAELTLTSRGGRRRVPLREYYTGDGLAPHHLNGGEIMSAVQLSPPPPRWGAAYCRFGYRKALEFSQFNLSGGIQLDDRGKIAAARMVVGAIGPAPVELKESVTVLVDRYPSEEAWEEAAERAPKEAIRLARSPRLTPYFQGALAVYARRLFREALRAVHSG